MKDGYNSQSTRFAMMDTDIQDLVRTRKAELTNWSGRLQTFHAQQRWQVLHAAQAAQPHLGCWISPQLACHQEEEHVNTEHRLENISRIEHRNICATSQNILCFGT